MKDLMSYKDISLMMNVSVATLRVWKSRGKLPEPYFEFPAVRDPLWKTTDVLRWAAEKDADVPSD